MSESTVMFTYTAPSSYQKYAENIRLAITHDLLSAPAGNYSYTVDKHQHQHFFDLAEIDESRLDEFMLAMESYCLKDRLLSCWIGNTSTAQYYALVDGKTQLFSSLEDYKAARQQSLTGADTRAASAVDFSEQDRVCTLLVRLKVIEKTRKQQIIDLFKLLEDSSDQKQIALFDEAVGALKNANGKQQMTSAGGTLAATLLDGNLYTGPQYLAKAYRFTLEENEYLYLGFDMTILNWQPHNDDSRPGMSEQENIKINNKRRQLVQLVYILGPNSFPSDECSAKYRNNSREELFIFDDDGVNAISREITADDDWNLPCCHLADA